LESPIIADGLAKIDLSQRIIVDLLR